MQNNENLELKDKIKKQFHTNSTQNTKFNMVTSVAYTQPSTTKLNTMLDIHSQHHLARELDGASCA